MTKFEQIQKSYTEFVAHQTELFMLGMVLASGVVFGLLLWGYVSWKDRR